MHLVIEEASVTYQIKQQQVFNALFESKSAYDNDQAYTYANSFNVAGDASSSLLPLASAGGHDNKLTLCRIRGGITAGTRGP